MRRRHTSWILLFACSRVADGRQLISPVVVHDALRGALLCSTGDAIAQNIEASSRALDGRRLANAAGLGTLWYGLVVPNVYDLAEHLFPGRTARRVLLKTIVSCAILSVPGNYANLALRRLLAPGDARDGSLAERVERALSDVNSIFSRVVANDLRVWPLYDVICYSVLPPHLRSPCTAVVSTAWHTYISCMAARSRRAGTLQASSRHFS